MKESIQKALAETLGKSVSETKVSFTGSELKKFWKWCGYDDGTRKYGDGEKSGKLINFFYDRFYKNVDFGVKEDPTASTREAFFISRNNNLPKGDRDKHVATKFQSDDGDFTCRLKKIKYGNHNAMLEILASHLYRSVGLEAPELRVAVCEEYVEGQIPDIYVASPLISGYYDLGDFLVDEKIITAFLKEEDLPKWREQLEIIKRINAKTKVEDNKTERQPITGEDKEERIKALTKIYDMMPKYVHREVEKSFIASKFIGNWDFANFNLNNIGVKFAFGSDRSVVAFSAAFVDFGNSAVLGFKGKYKQNSLKHANSEAKPYQDGAMDYDPALSFTEKETALITARQKELEGNLSLKPTEDDAISSLLQDLVKNPEITKEHKDLVKSIVRKYSHHIKTEESTLELNQTNKLTIGLLTYSDIPRKLPFYRLLKDSLTTKTKNITSLLDHSLADLANEEDLETSRHNFKPSLDINYYLESELEMSFRFSLLTDEVIERIVKDWYLYEEFPEIFQSKNPEDKPYSSADLVKIFKERRDFLATLVPHEVVTQWVRENPLKALGAQREVTIANLRENYQEEENFDTKYPFGGKVGESSLSKDSKSSASPTRLSRVISSADVISSKSSDVLSLNLSTSDRESPSSLNSSISETDNNLIRQQNSVGARIPDKTQLKKINGIDLLAVEIERHNDILKNEQKDILRSIQQDRSEAQQTMHDLPINAAAIFAKSLKSLISSLDEKASEIYSEINCKLLDFIAKKIPTWTKALGLEPDNNFLRLDQIQSMQSAGDKTDLSVSSHDILSKDANQKRNQIIDSRNQSTYEGMMKDLRFLSTTQAQGLTNHTSSRLDNSRHYRSNSF